MKFQATRWGEVEVPDDRVITFPEGLPGFSGKRYVLLHREETPMIEWLQSVDDPDVGLMTVDPAELAIDYAPSPKLAELSPIHGDADEPLELQYRVVIRSAETKGQLYLNLFAPVIINVKRRLAMQIPLVGSGYNVRTLWPPAPEAESTE